MNLPSVRSYRSGVGSSGVHNSMNNNQGIGTNRFTPEIPPAAACPGARSIMAFDTYQQEQSNKSNRNFNQPSSMYGIDTDGIDKQYKDWYLTQSKFYANQEFDNNSNNKTRPTQNSVRIEIPEKPSQTAPQRPIQQSTKQESVDYDTNTVDTVETTDTVVDTTNAANTTNITNAANTTNITNAANTTNIVDTTDATNKIADKTKQIVNTLKESFSANNKQLGTTLVALVVTVFVIIIISLLIWHFKRRSSLMKERLTRFVGPEFIKKNEINYSFLG